MGKTGLFDLERHFAFYGAYHSNPTNIILHMLCVWPTVFSTLVILYFTPSFFNPPYIQFCPHGKLVLNLGFFLTVIYGLFYICLDKKAGSLAALLCFLCWFGASVVAIQLGFSLAWKIVLAAQLLCWGGQFIGHGVFEKRAPALLDNLAQALVMGPFFVLLEALHMFCDYESYPGFHASVKAKIDAEISKFHDTKLKKIT
ncbi:hypothetical protein ACHQM5_006349 [Ranunculus cassubicifolius]